jgi:hypothetical protein
MPIAGAMQGIPLSPGLLSPGASYASQGVCGLIGEPIDENFAG